MNNSVFLRVNSREWCGWTSIRISAGIDRMARDFNVEITSQWPGYNENKTIPKVKNGDRVEVLIGTDLVLTGWVEALPVRYDATSVSMSIVGRSLTADLIDCSAVANQHTGKTLIQIATTLAKPFGVTVIDSGAPTDSLIEAQPEHGETVVDVLNRLLGQSQALAYDDEKGRLIIGTVGSVKANTALVYGDNILSCDTERSIRERFSDYQVSGQRAGNDDDFGEATISAIKNTSKDTAVGRYRPHDIQQTGMATSATCKYRCEFEAKQRAAKTDETTYTVQGWRQGSGELWQPNMRVIVYDPVLGFNNREMVIAEVTYTLNQSGTLSELRVGPADAYLPKPPKLKKHKKQEDDSF